MEIIWTIFYYLFASSALLISALNFFEASPNENAGTTKALWAVAVALALIALKV